MDKPVEESVWCSISLADLPDLLHPGFNNLSSCILLFVSVFLSAISLFFGSFVFRAYGFDQYCDLFLRKKTCWPNGMF